MQNTGWVKQPTPAVGHDHLGSQAPCIYLYGRLLPGITNVTDRARYYSFYPWFFWAYEKEFSHIDWEEVVDRFRKADCLFTLIALRHAGQTDQDEDNHGIAMVGRDTLGKVINEKTIFLATYATRESDNPNRYFKNKLGGLGQYYLGTLKDFGILVGNSRTGVQYFKERTQDIAEAMDRGVNRALFFETLKNDKVTSEDLDALSSFCPCQLSVSATAEQTTLVDLFFDRSNIFEKEGLQRRLTLSLMLHLINALERDEGQEPIRFEQFLFRAAVYTGHLQNETLWTIPEVLKSTRQAWGIYQKNEMLSVACQGIFWVVLNTIYESEAVFFSSDEFVTKFIESNTAKEALSDLSAIGFEEAVSAIRSAMPNLSAWENQNHEFYLSRRIVECCGNQTSACNYSEVLRNAINIILILVARENNNDSPYGTFELPENYYQYYPINLLTFRRNSNNLWQNLTLREILKWLAAKWCIETHLKVALRKLHRERRNTFKIHPTDSGLIVREIPVPIFTAPRFRQGIRILRDIGAIDTVGMKDSYKLTHLGHQLLGETLGS